ncbi:Predicted membrane protein (DUF2254) [Serratia marcescens]|uniref:DUF2254 domain-containing protein n=1 Tax=Enterobacterales TaxID=91347 RepID=UPI0005DE2D2C|nr:MULTISPECIES: DUF2254 domain-containing protein [Yersiniaceae]CNI79157.1 Predicted membrane protein (DUF2254) [Yersinia frederiksenii]CVB05842.1 Predicted membrane protein (DUF2254) [Serratia marcescens]
MTSKWQWLVHQLTRKLWFRASLYAILAVATALASISLKSFIPASLSGMIGAGAVDKILGILASSMLAVTTFSLNIMVSAYSAASASVTPRATRLLVEDSTTQNVLATFIGSFLFSLVGIVALGMGAYGEQGRVVLFIVTLAVIVLIVLTLLRWIQYLAHFGRMGETTERVELATHAALTHRQNNPYLGGTPWCRNIPLPDNHRPVHNNDIGYIQHIDMPALSEYASAMGCDIYIPCQPGAFVDPATPLLWLVPRPDTYDESHLLNCFTVDAERSFDQDPRFGLSVLSEIASRALSPAVNDPGTAIDVIGRAVRLLSIWDTQYQQSAAVDYPKLFIKPLETRDLLDDIFNPVARDGAAIIEVQIRLQKALKTLEKINPFTYSVPARLQSCRALDRARMSLELEEEKKCLEQIVSGKEDEGA